MLKKDLNILEDLYKGIGDSPSFGFEDIRNLKITNQPGVVSLNFKTSALTLPPTVSALAFTSNATTDVLTVASTSGWFNGMAVTLNTVVTSTGIVTGRVYWIGDLTATTFKLYKSTSLGAAALADVTGGDGSGTISSYTFGKPIDYTIQYNTNGDPNYVFIMDDNNRVWWINNLNGSLSTNLTYLGNDSLTGSAGKAVVAYDNNIFVFRGSAIDKLGIGLIDSDTDFDGVSGWDYAFDSVDSIQLSIRPTFVAQNNILYYGGDGRIGSVNTSAVVTDAVLNLPDQEQINSLGEIGQYLLIGGEKNLIYPWNKNTPSFESPIRIPELKINQIISTGQLAYVFAGNSGRIYVTNGVSAQLFKKLPEQITAQADPLITWGDALAYKNNLHFSFSATKNDGTALTTVGGVWGIDLTTGALRLVHQASYGSYAGTTHLIIPNVLATSSIGNGLIIPWANSATYGVDTGSTSYYTSYAGYAISPLYRVGSVKEKTSLNELEIILDKPLAANEGVRVSFRPDRNTAFSGLSTFDYTTYGAKQYIHFDFPAVDLVTAQFKIELTGTTTTPVIKDVLLR